MTHRRCAAVPEKMYQFSKLSAEVMESTTIIYYLLLLTIAFICKRVDFFQLFPALSNWLCCCAGLPVALDEANRRRSAGLPIHTGLTCVCGWLSFKCNAITHIIMLHDQLRLIQCKCIQISLNQFYLYSLKSQSHCPNGIYNLYSEQQPLSPFPVLYLITALQPIVKVHHSRFQLG